MNTVEPGADALWRYYQRGYHSIMRSGIYFRSILRPPLSHVYFQRAVPLLAEYARANRDEGELSPGFGDRLQACPLTPRDLLHLDYAICLGYAEEEHPETTELPETAVMDWPGLSVDNGVFIAADAIAEYQPAEPGDDFGDTNDEFVEDEDESKPPFDL